MSRTSIPTNRLPMTLEEFVRCMAMVKAMEASRRMMVANVTARKIFR